MEKHLAARTFFVGERYTIADIALFMSASSHPGHDEGERHG